MRNVVKAVALTKDNAGDDWPIADCGNEGGAGNWWIVTDHLHADEVPPELTDAKSAAELITRLLNEWWRDRCPDCPHPLSGHTSCGCPESCECMRAPKHMCPECGCGFRSKAEVEAHAKGCSRQTPEEARRP